MRKIFNNTKIAFELKSDAELNHAYLLYKMIHEDKITQFTPGATGLNLPFKKIVRSGVYKHFCGGNTVYDCKPIIETLHSKNVCAILDYTVDIEENEVSFNAIVNRLKGLVDFATRNTEIPFVVCKPSMLGFNNLFEKVSHEEKLSFSEGERWSKTIIRINNLCRYAFDNKVRILFDAEESWIQNASDKIIASMMELYNKDEVFVYNTFQMYRKDRMVYIKSLETKALKLGFKIGLKLVRGAYMDIERAQAKSKGIDCLIFSTKRETDHSYNDAIRYALGKSHFAIVAATHNEESLYILMQSVENMKLATNNKSLWFSQIYGMSDTITFNLADAGYNTTKHIPYGPMDEVMSYLIRRSEESDFIEHQAIRELDIIDAEKNRRNGKLF